MTTTDSYALTLVSAGNQIMVDEWLPEILITDALLDNADKRFLNRDGDVIRFTLTNGRATYRIVSCDEHGVNHAELVESEMYDDQRSS